MKRYVVNIVLVAVASTVAVTAGAQTCQVIGQMVYCQPAVQPDFSFLSRGVAIPNPLDIARRAAELRLIQQQAEMQRLQLDAMRRAAAAEQSQQATAKAENCHGWWSQWNHAPSVAVRQTIASYAKAIAPQCGF